MIAKGNTHNSGARLAAYMVKAKPGERVEIGEVRGFASDDIKEAFRSVDAMACGTRCEKPLFHTQVRCPEGEQLTREQWQRVADRIERKLGFSDQARAITFHIDEQTGDAHMHVGWSRIDEETMTAKNPAFFKLRLKEVSRELESELGLTLVKNHRDGPVMTPTRDEDEQARRLGVDLHAVRLKIRECWERSDNGHSFAAALADEGLALAKGERRDFIVIDQEGGMHALGKRILGSTAGEVRTHCADLDRESLPTVEQAREQQRTGMRDTHAASLAWENSLAQAAINKERIERRFAEPVPRAAFSLDEYERLASAVLDSLTKNRATFTRHDVERALQSEIEDKTNRAGMAGEILNHPDVVRLDVKGTRTRYSTTAVLETEQHVLNSAAALNRNDWHQVQGTLTNAKFRTITAEQGRAVEHATGPGGLAIIDGQAGTGKSYTMSAIREAYEAQGCRVVGLAPTNSVAQGMKDDGFNRARTIHSELFALNNNRAQWTPRTVVMVDEAAMIDTRILAQLATHANATGAKLILVGDNRQLSSIERGGMFEVLKERYGAAELTEVQRQSRSEDRIASEMMAQGNFADALKRYAEKDAIHWAGQQSEAADALVSKWAKDSAADPSKSRFVFAYTNDQVTELNSALRQVRAQRGELSDSRGFDTKHGRAEFAKGDRIQFTGTDKLQGIFNGQAGTVQAIDGTRFAVALDGRAGRTVEFDVAEFQGFRHGYAGTIYKGQGRTIDETYLYHSEHWRSASSYVAMTRHSDKAELFVARETAPDLPELARQMSRLDDHRAASHFFAQEFGNEKPLTPTELNAWYASADYAAHHSAEHAATFEYSHKDADGNWTELSASAHRADQQDARTAETEAREVERDGPTLDLGGAVGGMMGAAAEFGSTLGAIGALFGLDRPAPPQSKEEAQARRDARDRRAVDNKTASERRSYGQEMDTQKREREDREAAERERERKQRDDRQR